MSDRTPDPERGGGDATVPSGPDGSARPPRVPTAGRGGGRAAGTVGSERTRLEAVTPLSRGGDASETAGPEPRRAAIDSMVRSPGSGDGGMSAHAASGSFERDATTRSSAHEPHGSARTAPSDPAMRSARATDAARTPSGAVARGDRDELQKGSAHKTRSGKRRRRRSRRHASERTGSSGTARAGRAEPAERAGTADGSQEGETAERVGEARESGRLGSAPPVTVPPLHRTVPRADEPPGASARGGSGNQGGTPAGGLHDGKLHDDKLRTGAERSASNARRSDGPVTRAGALDAPTADRSASDAASPTRGPALPPRRAGRSPHHRSGEASPAYAALDLGTNNCRLLIATPTRGRRFRVVDGFSRIVRLGEGLGRSNALDEAAMDRAVAALAHCAEKLRDRPIRRQRLIATEACRRAANGERFIRRVQRETGLRLEIVDRRTEARLAVTGCAALIDRQARGTVLFDIGGGSTEIALIDLTRPNRDAARSIVAWTSLPVGVVTLSERFGGREVDEAVFESMVVEVSRMLEGFEGRQALRRVVGTRRFHLLGTSGTVTTLAGLHLELPRYDRRRVDGLWMRSDALDRVQQRLVRSSIGEREANACIGTDRADLVLAGCAILEAIRREWPSDRLRVADRGLREGLLSDMMVSDDAWSRLHGARAGGGRGQ